jgi:hypothetical protein
LILETSDIVTADVEAAGLITLQMDGLPTVGTEHHSLFVLVVNHEGSTSAVYLWGFSPNIPGSPQASPDIPRSVKRKLTE